MINNLHASNWVDWYTELVNKHVNKKGKHSTEMDFYFY